jgi:hypothetical protein
VIWDVTHASVAYGMRPEGFQYGLGTQAFPPLLDPVMLLPGEPGYPADASDHAVIGVVLNQEPRAYPLQIMGWHKVANERFGQRHVMVGYCPLAGLTAVYEREIDGQALRLSASGWTYRNVFVLHDLETSSLWYPLASSPGLTCISGVHADRHLAELPSSLRPWRDWAKDHADSGYLSYPGSTTSAGPNLQ